MAGMTDTAFRRLVKRQGGCGLVVTEMVSSEGLVRGIDRTLEYAEYTEEERPVSIQIFGGDPAKMADAAQIVEGMGADIVDVNMGCPVPKISKHNAGCSLMRDPGHAARVIGAMAKAVKIPVTVKMRAGWNDGDRNAPMLARMVQDAGAAAVTIHGRTAEQSLRACRLGARLARGDTSTSRFSAAAIASSPSRSSSVSGRVSAACSSAAACCAIRGSWRRPPTSPRVAGTNRESSRARSSSCSTTFSCCSTRASTRPTGSATSRPARQPTRKRRTARTRSRAVGHQQASRAVFVVLERDSTADRSCASASTAQSGSRSSDRLSTSSFSTKK